VLLHIVLYGCQGSAPSPSEHPDLVTITFTHGKVSGDPRPLEDLIAEFEAAHPTIRVRDEPLPPSTDSSEGKSKEVIMGIRPKVIRIQDGETSWKAIVVGVEPVGSHSWAELRWGDHVLRARLSVDVVLVPDQVVGLEIDTNDLHLFDAHSGERAS
jgi:ABC-type sugar transport system ATPase subunit